MTSIGHNPTFGDKSLTVETHILDFDRFIYDQNLALDFVTRLRPMVRFESAEQLTRQLAQDRENAKASLQRGHEPRPSRLAKAEDDRLRSAPCSP
jgi:riboflavin kinase/FMN adenylyltransferase